MNSTLTGFSRDCHIQYQRCVRLHDIFHPTPACLEYAHAQAAEIPLDRHFLPWIPVRHDSHAFCYDCSRVIANNKSVCVISIIRIPTLRYGASSPDPSYTNVTTALWSLAELQIAILCTSLPVLRPIVARFLRGIYPADNGPERVRDGPNRRAKQPRQHQELSTIKSLLQNTSLYHSTLRSVVKSTLRSELGTESREAEDGTQKRQPTTPFLVDLQTVTTVNTENENLDNRNSSRSSVIVMQGAVPTSNSTMIRISTSLPRDGSQEYDRTPSPPPNAAMSQYTPSMNKSLSNIYLWNLQEGFSSPPETVARQHAYPHTPQLTRRSQNFTIEPTSSTEANVSFRAPTGPASTPAVVSTVASTKLMHNTDRHSSIVQTTEIEQEKCWYCRGTGRQENHRTRSHNEGTMSEKAFESTFIESGKSMSYCPPVTSSWLRLSVSPDPEEQSQ